MQLVVAALVCLAAAAASSQQQPHRHYCNPGSPVTVSGSERDFSLITRPQQSAGYWPGLVCEFSVDFLDGSNSHGDAYFIEIELFNVDTAILSITSGGRVHFRSNSLEAHQSSLTIPKGELHIRFNATNDYSELEGVRIRVRAFDANGCPPGWSLLAGSCFGTSSTAPSLNYLDAQRACNSMRANLLLLPLAYLDRVGVFARLLPQSLRRTYTWVGLTDRTSAGQFRHFWLNGSRQYLTSEISCYSSGSSYTTCRSIERCGTFYDGGRASYIIYMDNCLDRNKFACSMPPGGASVYYTVPGGNTSVLPGGSSSRSAWVWGGIAVGLLVLGLAVVGVHSMLRTNSTRRAASAAPTATGRVASPPATAASGSAVCRYPEAPPPPPPPPPPLPPHLQPKYPAAPPSYDAAMADSTEVGRCNGGFDK